MASVKLVVDKVKQLIEERNLFMDAFEQCDNERLEINEAVGQLLQDVYERAAGFAE